MALRGEPAAGQAGSVAMLAADVTDDRSVEQAVAAVLDREGRLDIVVNNAGMGIAGPVENTSIEASEEATRGQFLRSFPGLPRRIAGHAQQGSGYIVNIGSIGGLIAIPYQAMYSASKFALEGLSEALRMEVRPFGIRVVIIEPGDHKTALTEIARKCPAARMPTVRLSEAALARTAHDEQSWSRSGADCSLAVSDREHTQSPSALHHRTRYPACRRVAQAAVALQRHGVHHAHLLRLGQLGRAPMAGDTQGQPSDAEVSPRRRSARQLRNGSGIFIAVTLACGSMQPGWCPTAGIREMRSIGHCDASLRSPSTSQFAALTECEYRPSPFPP